MGSKVKDVFIFDFDGTCTLETEEGKKAFMSGYIADFAAMLDKSVAEVTIHMTDARIRIKQDPSEYGWAIDGKIIAPALVDAFVEAEVCAQIVLKDLGESLSDWTERRNALYRNNYMKYKTDFRPELLDVLRELRDEGHPFYIVTNADPAKVQTRLEELGEDAEWIKPQVRGFAKKYIVTDGPTFVPEAIQFPGLNRPIFLRKQHYYDILETIRSEQEVGWRDLTVVGDIAELDLALPVALGAFGVLILGPNTPAYERVWAENSGNHTDTINNLWDIPF